MAKKERLLRTKWSNVNPFAQEVYTIWPEDPTASPSPNSSPPNQLGLTISGAPINIGGFNLQSGTSSGTRDLVNSLKAQGVPISVDASGNLVINNGNTGSIPGATPPAPANPLGAPPGFTFNFGDVGLTLTQGTYPPFGSSLDAIPAVTLPDIPGLDLGGLSFSIPAGAGSPVTAMVPIEGTGAGRRINMYALPNSMPGKIVSGSGDTYTVDVYDRGQHADPRRVAGVKLLLPPDVDPSDVAIDPETWMNITVCSGDYTMVSLAVWL